MKRAKAKVWPVHVSVYFPANHPRYPGRALTIIAHVSALTATEAAETVLAAQRAHWPSEWNTHERIAD